MSTTHQRPEPTNPEMVAFIDRITAPSRAAEAAVPIERTNDGGWRIFKGDDFVTLTAFEMRRLIRRVTDVQNVEDRAALGRTSAEDDPEILALVRP